jgi:hypothetical protein
MAEEQQTPPETTPPKEDPPKQDPPQVSGFTQDHVNSIVAAERKKLQDKLDEEQKSRQALEQQLAEESKKAEELQKKADAAAKDGMRMKVGLELGIPAPLVDRLQGDDEDALRKDAEGLKELIKEQPAGYSGPSHKPPPNEPEQDMSALIRRKSGR